MEDDNDPFGLNPASTQEPKRKRAISNQRTGDAKEIFVELQGIKSNKQVVQYDDEIDRMQRRRD